MKGRKKLAVMATMLLVGVMAIGAGIAAAQSPDSEAPAVEGANQLGPGDHMGPGGPGGFGPGRGHRGAMGAMAGGEVVSVDGETITLNTLRGEETTVKVNGDTIYRNSDGDASLAAVVAGEKIGVVLTEKPAEGEDAVAKVVMIGAPDRMQHKPAVGEVTAVDGNNVTINTPDGEQQFTIPAIEVGSRLGVAADEDGNVKGLMYDPPERPRVQPETTDTASVAG